MIRRTGITIIIMACLAFQAPNVYAGLNEILTSIEKSLADENVTKRDIIMGLKEALETGTGNAVASVSKAGGYLDNPEIRIPLPTSVLKAETLLRKAGMGSHVDAFEQSMNKAAEQAAPHAKTLFWDAIKKMGIEDAGKILKGRENEATLYFEDTTRDQLKELFLPLVHSTMNEVGVTRYYQTLKNKVKSLIFINTIYVDLDEYVTDRALDGLFLMIAEEEKKIREDPAARTTTLLKKVFGQKPK